MTQWKMVPVDPTQAMLAAIPWPTNVTPNLGVEVYRAMLAAAPAAPEVAQAEPIQSGRPPPTRLYASRFKTDAEPNPRSWIIGEVQPPSDAEIEFVVYSPSRAISEAVLSWDGYNVIGDRASVRAVLAAVHAQSNESAWKARVRDLEAQLLDAAPTTPEAAQAQAGR